MYGLVLFITSAESEEPEIQMIDLYHSLEAAVSRANDLLEKFINENDVNDSERATVQKPFAAASNGDVVWRAYIHRVMLQTSYVDEEQGEPIRPITFAITDQEDLQKVRAFQREHLRTCRKRFPDCTGALFTYYAIPTGLGTLYGIECPCGARLSLDGAMA